MPIDNSIQHEVDSAARIFLDHAQRGLTEIASADLDPLLALQAAVQMTMRLYADRIGNDAVAIQQIRRFVDAWEEDITELPVTFYFHTAPEIR